MTRGIWVLCLVMLHSPDGTDLYVESRSITAIRPAAEVSEHFAEGTSTVIYTVSQNFGVTEPEGKVIEKMNGCK